MNGYEYDDIAGLKRELKSSNRKWALAIYIGMLLSAFMGAFFGYWIAGGYA